MDSRQRRSLRQKPRRGAGLSRSRKTLLALDDSRRAAISKLQAAQERRNAASKEIGVAMKEKDAGRADALKAEVAKIKEDWPAMEAAEREAIAALDKALAEIPNAPLDSVPDGKDEHDNVEVLALGRAAQVRVRAERTFRSRRRSRPDGLRDRDEAFGRAFRREQGPDRAAGARAGAIHARSAHGRAWLSGG